MEKVLVLKKHWSVVILNLEYGRVAEDMLRKYLKENYELKENEIMEFIGECDLIYLDQVTEYS